jgi:hypothetical protein
MLGRAAREAAAEFTAATAADADTAEDSEFEGSEGTRRSTRGSYLLPASRSEGSSREEFEIEWEEVEIEEWVVRLDLEREGRAVATSPMSGGEDAEFRVSEDLEEE